MIVRELGRGGMAIVYLARDLKHDRHVAVKILRPELAAALGPDRFLREIRVAARLQHPHILPVFDSGEAGRTLWYTMPYVDGESLRDRLRREGRLAVNEAVSIALEVALALDYAHRRGVIHRDIKPENIMLAEGQALVTDFGIAKALPSTGDEEATEVGLSIGTPTYMSPEQATGAPLDGRSDVYSLGCVLFEMLAGRPPFAGDDRQAVITRRFVETAPSVRRSRFGISIDVDRIVARALARIPANRFATPADLARALGRVWVQAQRPGQTRELPSTPTRDGRWALFRDIRASVARLVAQGAARCL